METKTYAVEAKRSKVTATAKRALHRPRTAFHKLKYSLSLAASTPSSSSSSSGSASSFPLPRSSAGSSVRQSLCNLVTTKKSKKDKPTSKETSTEEAPPDPKPDEKGSLPESNLTGSALESASSLLAESTRTLSKQSRYWSRVKDATAMWAGRSSAYLQQAWDLAHSAEPLDEEFEYVIEFKGKLASESHGPVRDYVAYVLERNGLLFDVKKVNWSHHKRVFFLVSAPFDLMLRTAETLRIKKTITHDGATLSVEVHYPQAMLYDGIREPHSFFTPLERERIVYHLINHCRVVKGDRFPYALYGIASLTEYYVGAPAIARLLFNKAITQMYPLHDVSTKKWLSTHWVKNVRVFDFVAIDSLRNYFGEKIAFLLAFTQYLHFFMMIPAGVGMLVWLALHAGLIGSHVAYILMTWVILVWASCVVALWQRRQATLSYFWDMDRYDDTTHCNQRPEYFGVPRKSPITGKDEVYYPYKLRVARQVVCSVVTLIVVYFQLYLVGQYIELDSFVRVNFPTFTVVLSVVQGIGTAVTSSFFQLLLVALSRFSNHETEENHDLFLTWRLFIFEFLNNFSLLGYYAFWQQDFRFLVHKLTGLLLTRQLVATMNEGFLPYLLERFKMYQQAERFWQAKKTDESLRYTVIEQTSKLRTFPSVHKYYLDRVMSFAYVSLFGAVFLPGPLLGSLSIRLADWSCSFGLVHVFQKPTAAQANSIGPWQSIMYFVVVLSVISNIMLLYISLPAEMFIHAMPSIYVLKAFGFSADLGALEHMVISEHIAFAALTLLIVIVMWHTPPGAVWQAKARDQYLLQQAQRLAWSMWFTKDQHSSSSSAPAPGVQLGTEATEGVVPPASKVPKWLLESQELRLSAEAEAKEVLRSRAKAEKLREAHLHEEENLITPPSAEALESTQPPTQLEAD